MAWHKRNPYIRGEFVNLVMGPTPTSITKGTDGKFYCEDRHGKKTAGPYKTEREATKRAYHLVEKGRPFPFRQTPEEIDEMFEAAWKNRRA